MNDNTNPATKSKKKTVAAGEAPQRRPRWSRVVVYSLVALVAFVLGCGLLALSVWKAERLVALGLVGNLFYITLLPLGLASAAFLFGVLHSFAEYKGKQMGGVLSLGGPIIAFMLTVAGGFWLVPNPNTFSVTVFVHGPGGHHELILRNQGHVMLDLGGDRRRQAIGEKGDAYFSGIPPTYRGQEVFASIDAEGVEPVQSNPKLRLDSQSLYLEVRKKKGRIQGDVIDQNGNGVAGATIRAAGLSIQSDSNGGFMLDIPGDRLEKELDLDATATGFVSGRYKAVPNSNKLTIRLTRQ